MLDTDAGTMYGLGYVTAQERGFQMTYGLRIMQGRLAEVLGDRQRGGRREIPRTISRGLGSGKSKRA